MSEAKVKFLTATVRTLMIGSRQVTISVFKQLDWVDPSRITPFGRVRADHRESFDLTVVGADEEGNLVRSGTNDIRDGMPYRRVVNEDGRATDWLPIPEWKNLPLIVLAGMK